MTAKKSVGARLIEAMTEFTDALESAEPLETRLKGHTLAIDLTPTRYRARDVRATRRLLDASQGLFARFLGVALATVRAWEQGRNVPSGAAARLLDEIRLNPEFWRNRFGSSLKRQSTPRAPAARRGKPRRASVARHQNRAAPVKQARVKKLASAGPLPTNSHRRKAG